MQTGTSRPEPVLHPPTPLAPVGRDTSISSDTSRSSSRYLAIAPVYGVANSLRLRDPDELRAQNSHSACHRMVNYSGYRQRKNRSGLRLLSCELTSG